jgi:protein XRP2
VKKLDPSDFMFCERKGEKLVKKPGEIGGQQFILEDLEDCEVLLLDHCAQVSCPRSILLRR